MNADEITIDTPSGPQTLPLVQAEAMAACVQMLKDQGKRAIWHWNECRYDDSPCGGCLSVHEAVDAGQWVLEGWVIDRKGEVDFLTFKPGEHGHE
jgi:hypothetical protein